MGKVEKKTGDLGKVEKKTRELREVEKALLFLTSGSATLPMFVPPTSGGS